MAATHKGVVEITYRVTRPINPGDDEDQVLNEILQDWCTEHTLNPEEAQEIMAYTSDEDDDSMAEEAPEESEESEEAEEKDE